MATLFVVGTPIGNLADASPRMVETLRSVGLIAAEDTRITVKLLNYFDIRVPLTSCHQHNERGKSRHIVERMAQENLDVALVTDAGMPAISDPGYVLVREALDTGMEVCSVPGPSAALAALSVSGIDCPSFAFYGFPPRQRRELHDFLSDIVRKTPVAVLYESPHRIIALIQAVAHVLPSCNVCVCCDLTKRFEAAYRGDVAQVLALLQANPNVEKGEYCVVLDFSKLELPPQEIASPDVEGALLRALLDGYTLQAAVKELTQKGFNRNEAYRASLRLKEFLENWREL